MVILEAGGVRKAFGPTTILERICFRIRRGEKVGLVGPNGCGKSTLLKMTAGLEEVTEGTIATPKGTRVGYLAQEMAYRDGNTVHEEMCHAFDAVRSIEAEMRTLEATMQQMSPAVDTGSMQIAVERYGRLMESFERLGGFSYERMIDAILEGLKLSHLRDHPVESLSGGEKNIVALARSLLEEPDLLLLDEPANHLDFEGLAWLERFLHDSDRTVVLVSHNRYLLDRVVDRILEIEDLHMTAYAGNHSAYRAEKMRRLLKQKAAFENQQKEIRRMEAMIRRFEVWAKATGARRHAVQARNKSHALERINRVDRPELQRKRIQANLGASAPSGKIALELRDYSRAYGSQVLFRNVHLHLSFGERVGLIGANGSGKSTLLRDIVHTAAWENPVLRVGPRVQVGYYAQEHETLSPDRSVISEVQTGNALTREQAFAILTKYLFRWEDIDRKVRTLSGGEKSRLQLAKLVVSDANLLLLDEPTNHLDIQSCEQVEDALEEFQGTVLVISHDRYFLDRIVDRIVEIRDAGLVEYPGNFSQFWEKRRASVDRQAGVVRKVHRKGKKPVQAATRTSAGGADLEERIDALEVQKLDLEHAIGAASQKGDYKQGNRLDRKLTQLVRQIEGLYEML